MLIRLYPPNNVWYLTRLQTGSVHRTNRSVHPDKAFGNCESKIEIQVNF